MNKRLGWCVPENLAMKEYVVIRERQIQSTKYVSTPGLKIESKSEAPLMKLVISSS